MLLCIMLYLVWYCIIRDGIFWMLYCVYSVGLICILLVMLFFISCSIVLVVVFMLLLMSLCSVVGMLYCWVLCSICFSFFLGIEKEIKYSVFFVGFFWFVVFCWLIRLLINWWFDLGRGLWLICVLSFCCSCLFGCWCSCLLRFFCCFSYFLFVIEEVLVNIVCLVSKSMIINRFINFMRDFC